MPPFKGQIGKKMKIDLLKKLNWRYAVKAFDKNKKLNQEQLNSLLESLRLSASSFGLQPWAFAVIEDETLRQKLKEHSWNQSQITDASHLIVLCRKRDLRENDIEHFLEVSAKTRKMEKSSFDKQGQMIKGFVKSMPLEKKQAWMKDQVYLALGNLLTSCAVLDIDACPIEGFSPKEYDRLLDLPHKGLASVVVCAVGFRSDADKYQHQAKVRFCKEEVILKY